LFDRIKMDLASDSLMSGGERNPEKIAWKTVVSQRIPVLVEQACDLNVTVLERNQQKQ
jgi:hypothetical protein